MKKIVIPLLLILYFFSFKPFVNQVTAQEPLCADGQFMESSTPKYDQASKTYSFDVYGCVNAGNYQIFVSPTGSSTNFLTSKMFNGAFYETFTVSEEDIAFNLYTAKISPDVSGINPISVNLPAFNSQPGPANPLPPPDPGLDPGAGGGAAGAGAVTDEGIDLGSVFTLGADSTKSVASVYLKPAVLVNLIVRNLFIIAGIILFFIILFVGFKFNYQGTKGKDEAKTILTTAITGFIVMFVAYWIIQILEIITGMQIFI